MADTIYISPVDFMCVADPATGWFKVDQIPMPEIISERKNNLELFDEYVQ